MVHPAPVATASRQRSSAAVRRILRTPNVIIFVLLTITCCLWLLQQQLSESSVSAALQRLYGALLDQSRASLPTQSSRQQWRNQGAKIQSQLFDNSTITTIQDSAATVTNRPQQQRSRCAILMWGLPRSFARLVLPSLQRNVIAYNECDYYVHYYEIAHEDAGRSGAGGVLDTSEILRLRAAVQQRWPHARVEFVTDTNTTFWHEHGKLVQRIRTTRDSHGRYLYYPWAETNYVYPVTTDNIIKMWHSIQRVWQLMEQHELQQKYAHVAMMRSDVMYLTPLQQHADMTAAANAATSSTTVYVPGFGQHPLSDRAIVGPRAAVAVWATQRFARLEAHVQMILRRQHAGYGLHSERFVAWTIVPAVRQLGFAVVPHDTWCFVRARADGSVWMSDCFKHATPSVMAAAGGDLHGVQRLIENIAGHACRNRTSLDGQTTAIDCSLPR